MLYCIRSSVTWLSECQKGEVLHLVAVEFATISTLLCLLCNTAALFSHVKYHFCFLVSAFQYGRPSAVSLMNAAWLASTE